MRLTTIAVALALLAGCATPQEVIQEGARTDFKSSRLPATAAPCIERNASELKWGVGISYPARVREGKNPGELEVIYGDGNVGTIAVATIAPASPGSRVSIYSTGRLFFLRGQGTMEEQMIRGC